MARGNLPGKRYRPASAALGLLIATVAVGVAVLAAHGQNGEPATDAPEGAGQPKLVVPEPSLDLGTIQAGDTEMIVWRLENRGDANLVITRVKPDCGCTIVELKNQDRTIRPGDHFDLRAAFHSKGRKGVQNKTITVFSNDPTQPQFPLTFRATVDRLYEVVPSEVVNLRAVQRGTTATKTIDVVEDPAHGAVTVLGVELVKPAPLSFDVAPFSERGIKGQRIRVSVEPTAAVGTLSADAVLQIDVEGTKRRHEVNIRAEILGDVTWQPKIVDATRQAARPGHKLAPVDVRTLGKSALRITGVSAGPNFDVEVAPPMGEPAPHHRVTVAFRDDAEPGPIAALLRIETDVPDQPVIEVPVYAFLLSALSVDPPVVILDADGTDAGTSRRIKLQTYPGRTLDITSYSTDLDMVTIEPAVTDWTPQHHIRYFEVKLGADVDRGDHSGTLIFETSVEGFERIRIPVTVRGPK